MQEPTPVIMDKSLVWKEVNGRMMLKEVETKGYVIDLLEGLRVSVLNIVVKKVIHVVRFTLLWQALLSNPALCSEVMLSHVSTDGVMRDVCDGSLIKSHPVFQQYPDALQFIIYHDEIDVCNPLGSSAGIHKLGNHCCKIQHAKCI